MTLFLPLAYEEAALALGNCGEAASVIGNHDEIAPAVGSCDETALGTHYEALLALSLPFPLRTSIIQLWTPTSRDGV